MQISRLPALRAATGDRAARLQELSFQRYDTQAVIVELSKFQRIIHIINDENSAQKRLRDYFVFAVDIDKLIGISDKTVFTGFDFRALAFVRLDGRQWHECYAAEFVFFQVINRRFRRFRIFRNDILHGIAERRFNRRDKRVFHMN